MCPSEDLPLTMEDMLVIDIVVHAAQEAEQKGKPLTPLPLFTIWGFDLLKPAVDQACEFVPDPEGPYGVSGVLLGVACDDATQEADVGPRHLLRLHLKNVYVLNNVRRPSLPLHARLKLRNLCMRPSSI